jgi:hypothetical protein
MLTRLRWFFLGCVVSLGSTIGILAAFGQEDTVIGTFQPFVIDIEESVPVEVSVPISGSDVSTMTVPLTVGVSLRVNVEGPGQTRVEPQAASTPEIAVATVTPLPPAEEEAVFSSVLWAVERVESLGQHMELRDQDQLKFDTNGEFVLLHIALENVGKEPASIGYNEYGELLEIALVDDEQRLFAPFESGYVLKKLCENIEINPGLTAVCIIPFELPQRVEGLRLLFTETVEGEEPRIVELPVELE